MLNFLKKIFSKKPKGIDASKAKIDEQVYLLNYIDHYKPILEKNISDDRLAELFLFRAWTAQFGYRIFSTEPELSKKLIGETVNSCKYLGLNIFQEIHGFSVEEELGNDFISLIEDRWQDYDLQVSTSPSTSELPTQKIISVLCHRLNLQDPIVTYGLSIDFLKQVEFIKRTAIEIGVLSV